MSDKLPTREEAKNHANMFRCYVSGSGKAAYDVLTSYADGLLQPTQTYSEEELKNEIDSALYPNGHYHIELNGLKETELVPVRNIIAHALSGKLVKPVVDITKESLFKIFAKVHGCKLNNEDCMFSRCYSWSGCEVLAEAILKEI